MLLWVDHFIYCTCVLPGPTTASYFDEAVGDEWIFCHSENNTQPALIVLCRVCLLGNILVGISKSEWEALDSKGKKKKKKTSCFTNLRSNYHRSTVHGGKKDNRHKREDIMFLCCPIMSCLPFSLMYPEEMSGGLVCWMMMPPGCVFFSSPDTRKSPIPHHESSFWTSVGFNM